jgi:CRP-like cAMP-binding protein
MNLLNYLESIISVSEQLKQQLNAISKKVSIQKGQSILENGDRCDDLYFIDKGLLRGYYYDDDKEITNWIAQEGEFATCFYSFITQKQALESIQALEECELTKISFTKLQKLYVDFPETERIGRVLTENYYIKLEERLLSIQFKSAKERYQHLMETKPGLLNRAPLGHIASYLGISQETLSRMRSQL